MSSVQNSYGLDSLQQDFDDFIDNLSRRISKARPNLNIYNTRLGDIKKKLENIHDLERYEVSKVSEIVAKLNNINKILDSDLIIKDKELLTLVEGGKDLANDSREAYNNIFFELSMAARFIGSSNGSVSIKLDGDCDVIVDNILAVECKYIHSASNLKKNLSKAKKQIKERIENNEAKKGIIALDLTNMSSYEKLEKFSDYIFDMYCDNYYKMENNGHLKYSVADHVLEDRNFFNIISSFIVSEAESALYSEIGWDYDFGNNDILGIVFQVNNTFLFSEGGKLKPLSTRGMSFFVNKSLSENEYNNAFRYFQGLASGI